MAELRVLNHGRELDNGSVADMIDGDISTKLQKLMLQIKGEFMVQEGKGVDYSALRKSDMFARYVRECAKLRSVQLASFTEEERMAFFINIYNALTIHGICEQGVPTSVLEVKNFWKTTAYDIGGCVFTLDDIEHGILRGNRPHPSSPTPLFNDTDPRCKFSMSNVDPRIHFALVCGAKSCPAINVYSAKNLDFGLTAAAKNFCSHQVQIDLQMKQVTLSKIFLWYKTDFGQTDVDLLRWILPYLPEQSYNNLNELLKDSEEGNSTISVSYNDYNWSLNNITAANL